MPAKKIGPSSWESQGHYARVRVDKIALAGLYESAETLKTTRSDIIRKAIHTIHDGLGK